MFVCRPMSTGIGGPLGTAGKLFSGLSKNLEAPRLQMSHRLLRRLLRPPTGIVTSPDQNAELIGIIS